MAEGMSLNSNEEARKRIQMIRKQLTLEKLCSVFNDYIQESYPKEELTFSEFDSIFSPLLNNCEPLYKILRAEIKGRLKQEQAEAKRNAELVAERKVNARRDAWQNVRVVACTASAALQVSRRQASTLKVAIVTAL